MDTYGLIKIIWRNLNKNRKIQFYIITFIIFVLSICEVFSILIIGPLLQRLFYGDIENDLISKLDFLNYDLHLTNTSLLSILASVFILSYFLTSFGRLSLSYFQSKLGFIIGNEIGEILYKRYLEMSYEEFIEINSSEAISLLSIKIGQMVYGTIIPFMNSLGALISIIMIVISLLLINFESTTFAFISIIFPYLFIYSILKRIIGEQGIIINKSLTNQVKIISESFKGIKYIKLDCVSEFYSRKYYNIQKTIGDSHSLLNFSTIAPKYLIESVVIIVVTIFIYINTTDGILKAGVVTLLGVYIIAVQKLMPMMQSIYYSLASIKGSSASVEEICTQLIKSENEGIKDSGAKYFHNIDFRSEDLILEMSNVCFKYSGSNYNIINNFNFEIFVGDVISITGPSGAGKSTLINIISGLIKPKSGNIFINSRFAGDFKISYVSNDNFIADANAIHNIAIGIDDHLIDINRVINSAKISNIHNKILHLNNGYESMLGESGVLLSSGEKQRLVIARALYRNPDILILDEGTSALDEVNENQIINNIKLNYPNLSILLVTHNKNNLKYCNKHIIIKSSQIISDSGFKEPQ